MKVSCSKRGREGRVSSPCLILFLTLPRLRLVSSSSSPCLVFLPRLRLASSYLVSPCGRSSPAVGSTCCSYAGRHTTCREYCQAIFRTDSTPTVSQINAVQQYCQSHSAQLLNCVSNFTKSYPIRSPIDSRLTLPPLSLLPSLSSLLLPFPPSFLFSTSSFPSFFSLLFLSLVTTQPLFPFLLSSCSFFFFTFPLHFLSFSLPCCCEE